MEATPLRPAAQQGNQPDLRRVGLHPDFWYPFALSNDLKPKGTLGVTFAGEPIVLVRTGGGRVFALEDRCAHRQMPLHLGVVDGERIQCGYHGWCFDETGRIVRLPNLPKGSCLPTGVRAYPCREAYGLIFVFPGNPAKAAQVAFPDIPFWASTEYEAVYLSRRLQCHYSFMHENLMDQSHQFLHRGLLGNLKATFVGGSSGEHWVEARYKFQRTGGRQIFGARFLVGPNDQNPHVTIRTDYPYQRLTVQQADSESLALSVWIAYVPVDRDQRTNHSFGLLMIRKMKVPGLQHVWRPAVRYFTEKILAEDRMAVEAEQRAYDLQGADWNQEVFPAILDLRHLLIQHGIPLTASSPTVRA